MSFLPGNGRQKAGEKTKKRRRRRRILIFAVRNAHRTGWQTAQTRNYTIATMAEESVYALRSDGRPSSLDVLCGLELGRKPVRCFPQ